MAKTGEIALHTWTRRRFQASRNIRCCRTRAPAPSPDCSKCWPMTTMAARICTATADALALRSTICCPSSMRRALWASLNVSEGDVEITPSGHGVRQRRNSPPEGTVPQSRARTTSRCFEQITRSAGAQAPTTTAARRAFPRPAGRTLHRRRNQAPAGNRHQMGTLR